MRGAASNDRPYRDRDVIHVYFVHIHIRRPRTRAKNVCHQLFLWWQGKAGDLQNRSATPSTWGRRKLPTRMYYASPRLRSSEMEVEGSKCPRRNRMCPPPFSGRHTERGFARDDHAVLANRPEFRRGTGTPACARCRECISLGHSQECLCHPQEPGAARREMQTRPRSRSRKKTRATADEEQTAE